MRRRGYNLRHVAIVGAGALGQQIAQRLQTATWAGLNVVAFYDDDPAKAGQKFAGVPVLGSTEQLVMDLSRIAVDQVWIALPLRAEARIAAISISAPRLTGRVAVRPRHLRVPSAQPLPHRSRGPAGDLAHRDADDWA